MKIDLLPDDMAPEDVLRMINEATAKSGIQEGTKRQVVTLLKTGKNRDRMKN